MDDKILDAFLKHVSVDLATATANAVEGVLRAFEARVLDARRGIVHIPIGDVDGGRTVPRGDAVVPPATLKACADRVRELERAIKVSGDALEATCARLAEHELRLSIALESAQKLLDRVQLADALARKARVVCDKLLRVRPAGVVDEGSNRSDLLHLQRLATDHGDAAAAAAKAVDPGPKS